MKTLNVLNANIRKWLVLAALPLLLLTSCDKYLDVQPKGKRLLKTVGDYDLWLNNLFSLEQAIPNELNLLDDNVDDVYIKNPFTSQNNWIYTWQKQFALDLAAAPAIWKDFYESIYYYNTVLNGIDEATGGTEQQKNSIRAEAQLGRAFSYLYLVNLYGNVYKAETADKDLAVPFVTSNDLNDPTPPRSTVKEIYDHIIADINAAIAALPKDNNQNRFRGSLPAAYSVLARTYLYMGNFAKAAESAQLALDNGQKTVLDFGALSGVSAMPPIIIRPGAIYARVHKTTFTQFTPTLAHLKRFDRKDLRLAFYYTSLGDYSFEKRGTVVHLGWGVSYSGAYPNCGTSVEEMRLILAEAAARANDLPKAISELDLVRKARFKPADYQKYESSVQEEVLQKVLTERNLEFTFNSMRWFDMRRLDTEGRMPAVNRYDGQNNLLATLPPHSKKYTLQIPIQVMSFNPNWPQNPSD
ncbi:RagB/SusD family nutrient uptake outer membrane protein [Pedobacter deserti]|uniref:RagB/SusD family nutrient uptake outer membrane protein n=1 Tax=Pedobacter deserti TaxID=2817382 RepID=UPI00210EF960|nr:RagB/SusD family nutrient uptake outer membrane protein [Pedobacter sp. SYSU D00382]